MGFFFVDLWSTHRLGLLALVFEHISLNDKGNWTCNAHLEATKEHKSFELLVNR